MIMVSVDDGPVVILVWRMITLSVLRRVQVMKTVEKDEIVTVVVTDTGDLHELLHGLGQKQSDCPSH